jgi:hypothetical protein
MGSDSGWRTAWCTGIGLGSGFHRELGTPATHAITWTHLPAEPAWTSRVTGEARVLSNSSDYSTMFSAGAASDPFVPTCFAVRLPVSLASHWSTPGSKRGNDEVYSWWMGTRPGGNCVDEEAQSTKPPHILRLPIHSKPVQINTLLRLCTAVMCTAASAAIRNSPLSLHQELCFPFPASSTCMRQRIASAIAFLMNRL